VPAHITPYVAVGIIVLFGSINSYGPKHSGSLAVALAVPTVLVVVFLVALSVPHLTLTNLEMPQVGMKRLWVEFCGVILALSGVEAIANLTGVLKLDPGSTIEQPKVGREALRAILPVGLEVTVGTVLLGWAMLSLPKAMGPRMEADHEHMLRFMAEQYGSMNFHSAAVGAACGWIVGLIVGALLLSAVNTCIAALIGLLYMLARDDEMPKQFTALNGHGVPRLPLSAAVLMPSVVLLFTIPDPDGALKMLAGLYAIGVVGAIAVNVGSCAFNRELPVKWFDRTLFFVTFAILFAVEITLARTKPDALFFVVCVLGLGLGLRAWSHKRSGLQTITVTHAVADVVSPENIESLRPTCTEGQRIMVAARGITPVLRFALEEARLRKATLCVLYVKEIAVFMPAPRLAAGQARGRWQEDDHAAVIMSLMLKLGEETGVEVLPVFAVSSEPSATILDLAATLGVDYLMLGAQHRFSMAKLLKGNVVEKVAAGLPEDIQLIIHG
jgi:L-asparagine transporter-like permease/nucleotide-binding universal stress UspA family protein